MSEISCKKVAADRYTLFWVDCTCLIEENTKVTKLEHATVKHLFFFSETFPKVAANLSAVRFSLLFSQNAKAIQCTNIWYCENNLICTVIVSENSQITRVAPQSQTLSLGDDFYVQLNLYKTKQHYQGKAVTSFQRRLSCIWHRQKVKKYIGKKTTLKVSYIFI